MIQDKDMWMALVNTVINIRFKKSGNFLIAKELSVFQELLCSVEFDSFMSFMKIAYTKHKLEFII
jgi:hypothetical protein